MLKIKNGVDLNELKKYGFNVLIDDKELDKRINLNGLDWYCMRAYKRVGISYYISIENDEEENEIKIIPTCDIELKVSLSNQLDTIYTLIKDGLIEKV